MPVSASAQGKLAAQYIVTLAGIQIGKGDWAIDIGDDQYSAVATGATTGLMQTFSGGSGSGVGQGRVVDGKLIPLGYMSTSTSSKKSETIRLTLGNGAIREVSIEPEPQPDFDRIPVTDAHKRNVLDPMTGSLIRVPGTGDLLGREACQSRAPIFDGRMRYELRLEYKRTEQVKVKGYQGPVPVCGVYFTPVAGYIPDRPTIKYLAALREAEVWLAPIAGTRVMAPIRLALPTPLGTGVLQATEFVTSAQPARAAARTQ